MKSCKKNCSCSRCKSRIEPCDVLPVSKVLKAIEAGQIPKKECGCSARLNTSFFEITANICPNCTLQGSSVSFDFFGGTFTSTVVNPPQCLSTDQGIQLNVAGSGTATTGSSTIQAVFALTLLETPVGTDQLAIAAASFDQNGNAYSLAGSATIDDQELMITLCNSCPTASLGATNQMLSLPAIQEGANKGTVVLMKNGQIEVKEL